MHRRFLIAALFAFVAASGASAQTSHPSVDGVISPNEYGIHANGANTQVNGSTAWYMSWTTDTVYIGLEGTALSDAATIYFDTNPLAPINGGTDAEGSITGKLLNNTNFASLPFRADRVVYCSPTNREVHGSDGAGNWILASTSAVTVATSGTTREYAIPWSVFGGRPATFAWFGYLVAPNGDVSAEMPQENQSGAIGTSARFERYYLVSSTGVANSTWPFSQNSFVFNRVGNAVFSNNLHVHDFTMNSAGQTIGRATNSSTWEIEGNMRVDAGSVSFGNTYGNTSVNGNLILSHLGSLALSVADGIALKVEGDCILNGAFDAGASSLTLRGGDNTSLEGTVSMRHLAILKDAGIRVDIADNIRVSGTLALVSGNLRLGDGDLVVEASGDVTGGAHYSYVVTAGNGRLVREGIGTDAVYFPVGTESSFNPVTIANAGTIDAFGVGVKPAITAPLSNHERAVNRQWEICEGVQGASIATLKFQWNTADQGASFDLQQPVFGFGYFGTQRSNFPASISGSNPYTAVIGNVTEFDKFIIANSSATTVAGVQSAPDRFALHQNYPNPFNPSTTIRFDIPAASDVVLKVLDITGREVRTIVNEAWPQGSYSVKLDASDLPSGMYFYRLEAGVFASTRKLLLVK